jgi:hypothetical protein
MADIPAIRITAVDQASAVIGGVGRSLGVFAAQVASVGAVVESMRRALGLGDDLKRMADTTGLAVAKLDALDIVAKLNNASLDDMAKAFKFLGSSMVEAQTSSSQSAQLFGALGVAVKDASGNLRGVDDVMADTAKALDGIENETVRAAAGTAIFGKSYLAIAATLRNYAEDQARANLVTERFGAVSAVAAGLADDLGDKFTMLGEGSKRALLGGMVPGMAAVVAGLDTMIEGGGRFQSGFGRVVSWIAETATVAFVNLADVFEKTGLLIGATAAAIATASLEPFREFEREVARLEARRQGAIAAIRTAAKFPGLDDSDQISRAAGAQERLNKAHADSAALAKILAPATKDVIDENLKWLNSLLKLENNLGATQVEILRNEAAERGYTEAAKPMINAIELKTARLQAEKAALEAAIQADKEGYEWMLKIKKAYEDSRAAVQEYIAGLQFEIAAMQMSDQERQVAIALRELEKKGINLTRAELDEYSAAVRAAVETKAALQEQINLWQGIEGAAHDAFLHIFEGGKSVFDRLADSLKSGLLELLYQMTVKKWIIQIGAEVTSNAGLLGGVAGSGGGGGLGGITNALGSLFGGSMGFGTALGNLGTILPTFSTLLEGGATAIEAAAGAFAGMGASFAAVLGPIGAIAAGAMLLKNFLDSKKGGPKVGGFAGVGEMGLGAFQFDPTQNQGNAAASTVTQATLDSYNRIIALIGGKGSAGFRSDFSTDPRGTAANIIRQQAFVNGRQVYDYNSGEGAGNLGRDPAVMTARIELEAKRALLAALQASDLPQSLAKLFASLVPSTADAAAIDNVLNLTAAWAELNAVMNRDPMADALKAVADAAKGSYDVFIDAGAALSAMVANFDGSIEATQNLSAATGAYYRTQVMLLAQIEQVRGAIGDMFGSTIRSFTLATLDKPGQYAYLQNEAEQLRAQLASATDPAQIRIFAEKINADIQAAFGLLDPAEQAAMLSQFVGNIENLNADVNARLTGIEVDVQQTAADVFAAARAGFDAYAEKLAAIAVTQKTAADTQLIAARTPITVDVVVVQPSADPVNG